MRTIIFTILLFTGFQVFGQLYQVPVYVATSLQPSEYNYDVSNAIDNNDQTIYHSQYNANGIPDEVNFYFSSGTPSINKIIYTPRQSGTNGIWSLVNVSYSTQDNPNDFTVIASNLNWAVNNQNKEINLSQAIQNPYIVKFEVLEGSGEYSSCAEMRFYSDTPFIEDDGIDCEIPTDELSVNGANDVKATILVNGSTASSHQPGEEISKSFDNDLTTIYHSSWSNTVFPVVLNYRLDGTTPIDYMRYVPRADGGSNGDFGNVMIRYNTIANSEFQEIMTYDFEQSGFPVNVTFPYQITPLNVEITVYDGSGGFASCAEMEFYTQGTTGDPNPAPSVFADDLCSTLVPGTTQSQIDAISSPFYKTLAQCLFDGTYTEQYRVQDFEVYPPIASVSSELKVGPYDAFENATGILFDGDQKIALFAKNIPNSAMVYLAIKDFEPSFYGPATYYELQNGLNVFDISHGGLGYISYYNNDDSLEDVQLNIVSGRINGYFNKTTTDSSEWANLMSKTTYPMIDLIGDYVHLVYHREPVRNYNPFEGTRLLDKYDEVVKHQRMQMGLFHHDRSPKNRQLTYSEYGGGYWAGGGVGVHLDWTWGEANMADPDRLDMWGIPHEYGHINQIRPYLMWIGTTEVTNNIYSVWADYHMNISNVPYTRLEREYVGAAPGVVPAQGGRINGAIYDYQIQNDALQGSEDYDVFKVLVPFWQLELYYQLAGASRNAPILSFDYPTDYNGIHYAHWYGNVAEIVRTSGNPNLTNGEHLLNFVKNTCDVVQEDLTDFFLKTGFLKPVDRHIDDYGMGHLLITQAQIDATIAEIQSKNYEAPVSPNINYISAHTIDAYRDQLPLSGETGMGVVYNNDYLTVDHAEWQNAVAYETYGPEDELIFVSISGTGNVTNLTTKVHYPAHAEKVYAVGFDGERMLVYPDNLSTPEFTDTQLVIYPNPISKSEFLNIVSNDLSTNYQSELYNLNGQLLWKDRGNVQGIEQSINTYLEKNRRTGIYILKLRDTDGKESRLKLMVK